MRGAAAGVLIGVLAGGIVVGRHGGSHAQPAPAPDLEHAKELYKTAESEMASGRFEDASADYGAVYDITRDPVLFFKIASANEKAGKCDVALIYYGRYLREAKPPEKFVAVTQERIVACGGDARVAGAVEPAGDATGSAAGSADGAPASGSAAGGGSGVTAEVPAPVATGVPVVPLAPVDKPAIGRHKGAWLLISGSIAFITIGAVLAYSASTAENDVADLYVGFNDQPPVFDERTQKTYDALISDGHRYEVLSWVSFGLAGAAAAGATVLFLHGSGAEQLHRTVRITPTVRRDGGGVAATISF
jgi:hypothetical protein